MMHFPDNYGLGYKNQYVLHVTYSVLPPKLFKRFYPPPPFLKDHDVLPNNSLSPYAQFKGLPFDSFEVLTLGRSHIHMKYSSIQKIPATSCKGHFDGNPTLPIAFLATFCSDLSGKAIGLLVNKVISFDRECAGPGKMQEKGSNRNKAGVLKFLSVKVDAFKLVQADTHRIYLLCEVTKEDEKALNIYSSDVTVMAARSKENEDKAGDLDDTIVAKLNMRFELLD